MEISSTSYLSATEHGDPIAVSRLFIWGVSSHILFPFTPPPSKLEGQEAPQPISTCMNSSRNRPINALGSISTTSSNASQSSRPRPSLFQPRPLAIVTHGSKHTATTNNIVLDTRHPGIDADSSSLANN